MKATRWDRVARWMPGIGGLNRMAWWVGRLPWDPWWGSRVGTRRNGTWRKGRIHRRRVRRVDTGRVRRVGRIGCARVGTWLA